MNLFTHPPSYGRIIVRLLFILLLPLSSMAQVNTCGVAAPLLNSQPGTCVTPTTGSIASATNDGGTGCPGTERGDVWYRFTAKSTNPTITLSGFGANFTQPGLGVLTACGGTTLICENDASVSPTGLTIGTIYYIRVYTTNNPVPVTNAGFSICIVDPVPSNDNCAGPSVLTSGISCSPTTGNFYASTASAIPEAPCTGPVITDLWYSFVAQASSSTITMNPSGTDIVSPQLQLFSGTCAGLTSVACGTTSIAATGLTPGATYLVRAYYSGGSIPAAPTNAGFTICVTHPAPPVPANDNCVNAINLPVNITCSKTFGTVAGATSSGVAAPCATPTYDVWYQFTAGSANTTISVGDLGSGFTNRRIQLLSGSCAGLTSLYCVNASSIAATGLTPGNIYYVRIFSTSATAPNFNGDFSVCVINTPNAQRFGNSYVNVSKKTTGGVVEPGDTLEIRMTINHISGTVDSMRYVDSVPSNTQMLTGASDRIRVITNEGVAIQSYTLTPSDDAATYVANPPAGEYHVRMNMAFGASSPGIPINNTATERTSATGRMVAGSDIPRGGGGMLFATSFRVQVTGVVGDVITLGMGKFVYNVGGSDVTLTATPYKILISQPRSLCTNATGINMSQEFGGTFGAGTTLNRPTDLTSPISGYTFINIGALQGLGDGQYSIVKNMSPRAGTNRNAERTPTCPTALPSQNACANRMHGGHWDIDGDHTGTTDAIGNIPQADGVNGGYMLMVNADYIASETYNQTINNLCPNTYYEFSAWIRNNCPTCGIDYNTGGNYTPRTPGVLPNLTFALDGLDRYNTGEVAYASGWVKKGFVFITGSAQTSATFTIRNNSQGGGGNDWVMDDISVATCLPNMSYSPSLTPTVCEGNSLTIYDTVTSYFNNYNHFQWQRSSDNGATWNDVGSPGSATPVLNGNGEYQYITSYTIPPGFTNVTDSGNRYRVIVATTNSNLSSISCQVTDGISIIDLAVLDCGPVLSTNLVSFNGRLTDGKAQLSWTTSKEENGVAFTIEKSFDGRTFLSIGTVSGLNNGADLNRYSFTDPQLLNGKAWFRITMNTPGSQKKLSSVIQLKTSMPDYELGNVINPFTNSLKFDVIISTDAILTIELIDINGRVVRKEKQSVSAGVNSLSVANTGGLQTGAYSLRVIHMDRVLYKRVLKNN